MSKFNVNKWMHEMEEGRRKVLLDDKWFLIDEAIEAATEHTKVNSEDVMADMCEIMNWLDPRDGYMPTCQDALMTESKRGWAQQVRMAVFRYMQLPFSCDLERAGGDLSPIIKFHDEVYGVDEAMKKWAELDETERINFAVFYGTLCEMKRRAGDGTVLARESGLKVQKLLTDWNKRIMF